MLHALEMGHCSHSPLSERVATTLFFACVGFYHLGKYLTNWLGLNHINLYLSNSDVGHLLIGHVYFPFWTPVFLRIWSSGLPGLEC